MNWKGCGRRLYWPYFRFYHGTFLEGFKKTMQTLRIIGVPAEIRTGNFSKGSQKRYHFSQPAWSNRTETFIITSVRAGSFCMRVRYGLHTLQKEYYKCLEHNAFRSILLIFGPNKDGLSRNSDWLRAGRPRSRSLSPGRVNFLFSTSSRPALGSTQPPSQWVPGAISQVVKRPGRKVDYTSN
jgi:hypothetical protein